MLCFQVLVEEHNTADLDADRRDVSKIRSHPRYNYEEADYDFSILFLSSTLTFSSTIAPVCLPASTQSLYTGQVATVTGWGDTGEGPSSTLQEAEVTVISNKQCSDYYPGKIKKYGIQCGDLTSITISPSEFTDFKAPHCTKQIS